MKRLVYAPQVNVWIKTDTGIFDLSSYITDFSVHRQVNAISSAQIKFRNPKAEGPDGEPRFMFTQHPTSNADGTTSYSPMFHPMDPIVISLTRLKGYPVQVFTGYCDSSPYVQLYPGLAQMTASCSLKKLKHTYWDPGLPFVSDYLEALGWKPTKDGGLTFNPTAEQSANSGVTDTSFAYLIYRILQDVGGWNHNDIYVQGLPSEAIQTIVTGIYTQLTGDAKANFKDVSSFLDKVIGATTVGGAAGNASGGGGGGGVSPNTGTNDTSGDNGILGGPFPVGQEKVITATTFYRGPDMGGAFKYSGFRTPDGVIPGGEYPGTTPNRGHWWAEPSVNPDVVDGSAMGNLPAGTPVKITYKGKSIIARKADIGAGGSTPMGGHPDCMDIFEHGARTLGLTPDVGGVGKDVVKVTVLNETMVKELRRTNKVIW